MGCSLHVLHSLVDMIAPPLCPICREQMAEPGEGICAECRSRLPLFPERRCKGCGGANDTMFERCHECLRAEGGRPWHLALSAFPFFGEIREAIHTYKYQGVIELAPFFARRLAAEWGRFAPGESVDAITYIPLHPLRFLQRGYNQAEEVALFLGRELKTPVKSLLKRTRYTRQQAKLNMKNRLVNMSKAFRLNNAQDVKNKRILLVDDVFTTGATLTAATRCLLTAGAAQVDVMTIARD